MTVKTGEVIIRVAEFRDIEVVAAGMRRADRIEIFRSHLLQPQRALEIGWEDSTMAFVLEHNDKAFAMFGLVEEDENTAVIWMLGTDEVTKLPVSFIKAANHVISRFLTIYERLHNYVDVENVKAIEWLKRCGATFDAPAPYGVHSCLFQKFTLLRRG